MESSVREQSARFLMEFAASHRAQIGNASQIVLVAGAYASSLASIFTFEGGREKWNPVSGPIRGNTGKNGFAAPGTKREGDGKTPSGVFRLGTAFGYAPAIRTEMIYRQAGEDDFWVNDVNSPDYNRWVRARGGGVSWERMKRDDDLHKYGIVVEYNTSPVVKGLGSAIFFHVWRGEGEPTDGCISMPEDAIAGTLAWLHASAAPVAVMGAEKDLLAMP
ncbi:MAG: L,D-transpeptidase family protein [Syntrophorhabdales bacterium]|jgi:L,D-peptidoglycan transpeptidase YkuD (ErfK/YbiS/YcfS/YnhG family)